MFCWELTCIQNNMNDKRFLIIWQNWNNGCVPSVISDRYHVCRLCMQFANLQLKLIKTPFQAQSSGNFSEPSNNSGKFNIENSCRIQITQNVGRHLAFFTLFWMFYYSNRDHISLCHNQTWPRFLDPRRCRGGQFLIKQSEKPCFCHFFNDRVGFWLTPPPLAMPGHK